MRPAGAIVGKNKTGPVPNPVNLDMRMGGGDQQPLEGFRGRAVPEMGQPK
jgi:hypothetical protein